MMKNLTSGIMNMTEMCMCAMCMFLRADFSDVLSLNTPSKL